nr:MAG TPA: hypothetical protein [Caudoviricetes sp.]
MAIAGAKAVAIVPFRCYHKSTTTNTRTGGQQLWATQLCPLPTNNCSGGGNK